MFNLTSNKSSSNFPTSNNFRMMYCLGLGFSAVDGLYYYIGIFCHLCRQLITYTNSTTAASALSMY